MRGGLASRIERLEALVSLAFARVAGGPGGSPTAPLSQLAWHVNAITGTNTASGLTGPTAVKTIAEIGRRFRAAAAASGGGRPTLTPSSGSTITIFVDSDLPTTDPLAPVLDVDLAASCDLVFVFATKPAVKTSSLTTASTFVRTSAGGVQTITDATVGDFSPFFGVGAGSGMLFEDTTTACVSFLLGPTLGGPAGILAPPHVAQAAGVASLPALVQPLALDTYTLRPLTTATLGSGFVTRSFPSADASGVASSGVFFYRGTLTQPNAQNDVAIFDSPGVGYVLQECIVAANGIAALNGAAVSLVNCAGWELVNITSESGAALELLGGGVQGVTTGGNVLAQQGGTAGVDLDYLILSDAGQYEAQIGALLAIGNAGRFPNTAAIAPMLKVSLHSTAVIGPLVTATGVLYGADNGNCVDVGTTGTHGSLVYSNTGATSAVDQIKGSSDTFLLGRTLSGAWGVDPTTGLAVGVTACALTKLDTALGAGTGFGGTAMDSASGAIMTVA